MSETVKKEKRTDVGRNKPPADKRFSKENRPDEAKRIAGIKKAAEKKRFTRDVMKGMLTINYKFAEGTQLKQQLVHSFGDGILEMSVAEIMVLQQMQRAILKGDTYAFNSLMDQALGKPMQSVANVDPETGKHVKQVFVIGGKEISF